MGLFRLFDGAQARERYPLLAKDPLRGHKSPICEECRKANFLLKKLTWGNAGRSASERFPSDPRTHISPIIVHRALFFEEKGGGKTAFWMLASQPVSRGRVTTSAIPLMCRGMTNHRHAVSVMPLTHRKPECHVPCFKKKVSGKRAGRGVALPLHGVLRQVVGLILLKIPIEQSHGVSHAWLLANMLGVKKSHVAHRFRGR